MKKDVKSELVAFKISKADMMQLKKRAKALKLSVSGFVRMIIFSSGVGK